MLFRSSLDVGPRVESDVTNPDHRPESSLAHVAAQRCPVGTEQIGRLTDRQQVPVVVHTGTIADFATLVNRDAPEFFPRTQDYATVCRMTELVVPRWDAADRMRKALRFANVGVGEMAEYLGVTPSTVSTWINGRFRPSPQTLRLWSIRTGVPLSWLETGEELPRLDSNQQPSGYRSLQVRRRQMMDSAA